MKPPARRKAVSREQEIFLLVVIMIAAVIFIFLALGRLVPQAAARINTVTEVVKLGLECVSKGIVTGIGSCVCAGAKVKNFPLPGC